MIKILHIDTELTWRGGENQLRLLIENTRAADIKHYVACDPHSIGAKRFSKITETALFKLKGVSAFKSAIKIGLWTRKNDISIIDCQTSKAHTLALIIKLINPKIKIVVHRRVDFKPGSSLTNQLKYKTKAINTFVAISSAIGEVLRTYGIAEDKINIVPSAVDKKPFIDTVGTEVRTQIRSSLDIKDDTTVILAVAYFTHQKGHETLLKSLGELNKRGIKFQCLLAGEGELRSKLEELAVSLNISDKVKFLGVRKDIPELMRASDILSMPSNYEGLGTTLLDAVYSDLPIVASNVGGIPEIVIDGETGFLSEVGDYKTHALKLEKLILSSELCKQMSQNAREHVDKNFSLENMVEGNISLYRKTANIR